MSTTIRTLERVQPVAEEATLQSRLAAGLSWIFERWTDDAPMVSGDADSSLLGIGRDLRIEDGLFYGFFVR